VYEGDTDMQQSYCIIYDIYVMASTDLINAHGKGQAWKSFLERNQIFFEAE
jgi:hypothetical protein